MQTHNLAIDGATQEQAIEQLAATLTVRPARKHPVDLTNFFPDSKVITWQDYGMLRRALDGLPEGNPNRPQIIALIKTFPLSDGGSLQRVLFDMSPANYVFDDKRGTMTRLGKGY
ncbi:hypothetical protein [Rahnella aceris]|uniref:hypothetical protein n=1 Tax=Rahnella sp. (strain Y9602) TaxID=2703885 RepID=UPI003BA0F5A1